MYGGVAAKLGGIRGWTVVPRQRASKCLAQAGKSPAEKAAKKQRRKEFLQRRREAAAWRYETQRPGYWYEVHEEGIWEEHRQPPTSLKTNRAASPASAYYPTVQELAAVSFRSVPPPPAEWTASIPSADVPDTVPASPSRPLSEAQKQRVQLPAQPWKNLKKLNLWKQQRLEDQLQARDI